MEDLLSQSTPELMEIVLEYAQLATLPTLTTMQADRLGEILEDAIDNALLSFWITELDHSLSHRLQDLTEEHRKSYRDQQALLREYSGGGSLSDSALQKTSFSGDRFAVPCSVLQSLQKTGIAMVIFLFPIAF